jgi:SAM-dependent methyltransferase
MRTGPRPDVTQTPEIFDTALLARRAARAHGDFVSSMAADDLNDRLGFITRDIEKAALIAPNPAGLLNGSATANGPFRFEPFATLAASDGQVLIDPARFELPANDYQLIASLLDMQFINDVPGFLANIRRHLAPDGLFIAAAIGGHTLTEPGSRPTPN